MRTLPLLALGGILLAAPAHATLTLNFNAPFGGGISSNFADATGTVPTGGASLTYGILIDTASDGFLLDYNSDFNLAEGSLLDLTTGFGAATDDQLFVSVGLNNQTTDLTGVPEGNPSFSGGPGALNGAILPDSVAGLPFAVIWFDAGQNVGANVPDGSTFGLLTDAGFQADYFVLPGPGNSNSYDAIFAGEDPVRSANDGVFTAIPEPSSLILLSLGGLGLLRRRR